MIGCKLSYITIPAMTNTVEHTHASYTHTLYILVLTIRTEHLVDIKFGESAQ